MNIRPVIRNPRPLPQLLPAPRLGAAGSRPDGTVIFSNSFVLSSDFSNRLPVVPTTGTYTVHVTPAGNTTGAVQITLWKDMTAQLTLDTPFPVQIDFRNQQARLTFSGTTGQNLGLNLSGVTLPSGGTVNVLQPDGLSVFSASFGTAGINVNIPTLTSTGIHTVHIIPNGTETGTLTVNVFNR